MGAHVDGNDDTAGHCLRGTPCGQVLETLDWCITRRRQCRAYITSFTQTIGGSGSVSRAVDSA